MLPLLLLACDLFVPKDEAEPEDTAVVDVVEAEPADAALLGVLAACTADGLWTYEAWTDGPVSSATVQTWAVREVDGWNEGHALPVESSSALGASMFLQLESGVDPADYLTGTRTPLVCGVDDRGDDMAYVVRVYADDGTLLDCVGWGSQIYAALGDPTGGSSGVPSTNPVDRADEISRTACRALSSL